MTIFRRSVIPAAVLLPIAAVWAQHPVVGPAGPGATTVTTGQLVRPAGVTVELPARPVDLVLSPDARFLFAKESKGVAVVDAAAWTLKSRLALGEDAASMTGLAIAADGRTLYVTDATTGLHVLSVSEDGALAK